jgi:hypothetical protein
MSILNDIGREMITVEYGGMTLRMTMLEYAEFAGRRQVGGGSSSSTPVNPVHPPTGLTVTAFTDTTVSLSWTAPAAGETPTDYLIEVQAIGAISGAGPWTPFAHSPSTTTSIVITSLTQSYKYKFRVSTVSGTDTSLPTSAIQQVTLRSAPFSLAATGTTNTTISLSWNYLDNAEWQPVTSVNIYDRVHNTPPYVLNANIAPAFVGTATGLIRGQIFDLQNTLVNSAGESAVSNTITQVTKNPPGKPTIIKGHPGNQKIFVNGTPAATGVGVGGVATSWVARAYPQPSGSTVTLETTPGLNPDATVTALVDMLTNGTAYNVTLAGKNADGEGPESDPTADSINIVPFGFALTDLGSQYWGDWSGTGVTLSGPNITSINDISGNARHASYVSGTHATVNAAALNGRDSVRFTSDGLYHYSASEAINTTARYAFSVFQNNSSGSGGFPYTTTNEQLGCSSGNTVFDSVTTLTGGATTSTIVMNSALVDMTRAIGHKITQWKNGDQGTTADANSGGITSPNTVVALGSQDGSNFFNLSDFGRAVIIDGLLTSQQIQQVEGLIFWSFPLLHLQMGSHPYATFSPSGEIDIPGTPSIAYARPNGSGTVNILITPGDEGGALVTYYITSSPGSISGNTTDITLTMTGFTDGTPYTLTPVASSVAGSSAAGSASASVTTSATSANILTQWKMSESSGNRADSWYSVYNLTISGTVGGTTINGFNAANFSGSGYFTVGATSGLSRAFDTFPLTISFWINTTTNTGTQLAVIGNYGPGTLKGIMVALVNGQINTWAFTDGTTSNCVYDGGLGGANTGAIHDGLDHHIVIAMDTSNFKVYVDNVLIGTTNWTGSAQNVQSNATDLVIGRYNSNNLTAKIAKLKWAQRKWSATDVAYDWNGGAGRDL